MLAELTTILLPSVHGFSPVPVLRPDTHVINLTLWYTTLVTRQQNLRVLLDLKTMYHCVDWPCNIGKPLFPWIRNTITSLKDVYSNLDSDVLVMVWGKKSLLACLWKQKYVTIYLLELYSFSRVWLLEWLCSRIGRLYVGGLSDIWPQMKSSSFSIWSNRSVVLHHLFISFIPLTCCTDVIVWSESAFSKIQAVPLWAWCTNLTNPFKTCECTSPLQSDFKKIKSFSLFLESRLSYLCKAMLQRRVFF